MAKHLTLNRIRLVSGGLRMRNWSGTRKPREREPALGWAVRFYHVNAVRTSQWNETHSGIKFIPVSSYINGPLDVMYYKMVAVLLYELPGKLSFISFS